MQVNIVIAPAALGVVMAARNVRRGKVHIAAHGETICRRNSNGRFTFMRLCK